MMNQSMQSMYKATSSGQNSEDEGEHDQITDLSKANEMMQGKFCTCHRQITKFSAGFKSNQLGSVYILGLKWNLGQKDDDYEDLFQ